MVCILAKDPVTAKSPAYHGHLLHRTLLNLLDATACWMIAGESGGGGRRFQPSSQPTLGLASELSGYPDKASRRPADHALSWRQAPAAHTRAESRGSGPSRPTRAASPRETDSPLEERGFEPSVPITCPSSSTATSSRRVAPRGAWISLECLGR
jgi:hypothetical protein